MSSETLGVAAPSKSSWKLVVKIAYLIVAVPAVLLFFGLIIGIPN